MLGALIPTPTSKLWFPFTTFPDQATFTPGSVLLAMRPDGTPVPRSWPTPISIRSRWIERLRIPANTTHFIALTTAVRVGATWLSARFLAPRSPHNPARTPLWQVWPLEEWAGPSAPLDQDAWSAVDATSSVASLLPPSSTLPLSAITDARVRVTTSDPWFANRPALRVDPADPWNDLCHRWADMLAMLGYPHPDRAQRPHPSKLLPNPDWWLVSSGNTNHPDLGSLRLENKRGLDHLPGWSDWYKEWNGNPYERQTQHLVEQQKGLVDMATLWVLDKDSTLLPLKSALKSPRADQPKAVNDPRYRAAASIHLATTRGAHSLCAHTLRPREYSATSLIDLDPTNPDEHRFMSIDQIRDGGWGAWDRFGDIDVPRTAVDSVHASIIGVGRYHGQGAVVPLPAGGDLSDLFSRPELITSVMGTFTRRE